MHNASRIWLAIILLAGLAGASSLVAADKNAEKQRDAENKAAADQAKTEERLEMVDQVKLRSVFNGVVTIQADLDNNNPEVVGALTCTDDQKVYFLKVDNKDTLKMLQNNDNHKITICGRLRNEGKYLVVTGIIEHKAGPPRVSRRTVGGL